MKAMTCKERRARIGSDYCHCGEPYYRGPDGFGSKRCKTCSNAASRRSRQRKAALRTPGKIGRPRLFNCTHEGTADFTDSKGYQRCRDCVNEQRRSAYRLKQEGSWPRVRPLV